MGCRREGKGFLVLGFRLWGRKRGVWGFFRIGFRGFRVRWVLWLLFVWGRGGEKL